MGDMESNRRSLLLAAPLLLAAVAGGDKSDKTGKPTDIKLSPAPESGPDPAETFVLPYDQIGFSRGATCRQAAAKWPCYTAISTSPVPIWS